MAGERPGQGPQGIQSVNWRRFAVLASAIITTMAVIRLLADAAGVPRGTVASAVVGAISNFIMYMALGLATPYVLTGVPKRPVWRRLVVLVPIATVGAVMNFLVVSDAL